MKPLPCSRAPLHLWIVSLTEYFLCLINPLNISSQCSNYVETRLFVCTLNIPPKVSNLSKFISYKPCENGKYTFLKQTSRWSLDRRVMFGSTLPSVVSIYLLQFEICILFFTWPHKTTPLRCHAYSLVRAPAACHHPEHLGDRRHSDKKRKNVSSKTWI